MRSVVFDATIENIEKVTEFVDSLLEENDCSMKAQMQIDVAIDELFSNIAYYAYNPNVGKAELQVEFGENPKSVSITFIDSGKPYNPLEKEDPDVTLSAEERGIGGLGIYMVKKSMDNVSYEYSDGKNKLTIVKNI